MHQMRARDDAQAATAAKPPLKQRLSALFEEYGRIAVITYFTLSILTIIGFSVAIWTGVQPSSETGVLGVIIAGWALGKATLPIRIPITLALTPVVAYVVRRRRGAPDQGDQDEPGDAAAPDGTPPAPGAGAP
jgi:hypothetical protein